MKYAIYSFITQLNASWKCSSTISNGPRISLFQRVIANNLGQGYEMSFGCQDDRNTSYVSRQWEEKGRGAGTIYKIIDFINNFHLLNITIAVLLFKENNIAISIQL